jgi:hypothetical protein
MFTGHLAKLADPIGPPVTAHLPGALPLQTRARRRAVRPRHKVLTARRLRRLA